jgi:hypothetical protein
MPKHTPGPWSYSGREVSDQWGGRILLTGVAITCGRNDDYATAEANSRLIAASPDLLEACQAIKDEAEDCIGYLLLDKSSAEYRAMLSAIAKATEGQP